jgi:hypothetical protein
MKFGFLRKGPDDGPQVSTFRLYTLRAMYLYMVVGLVIYKWPEILNPPPGASNADSVVGSVLGAFSLLALLGLRYPVKMIPLLFMEFLFKFMWLVGWGIPLLLTDTMGPEAQLTLTGVLMGVVLVPLTIPWGYVFRQFVTAPGDRWRKQVTVRPPTQPASAPYEAATISGA